MYSSILFLPIDVLFRLFNIIVVPIITHGCQLWRSNTIDVIEKLQLGFFICTFEKYVNKCTCSNMMYVEVGTPSSVNIKTGVLLF